VRRGEPGSLRAVALPTEHGGWGFTLEPIVLGLAVAAGPAGAGLAAAAAVASVPWATVAALWAWAALSLTRSPVPPRTLRWTQMVAGLLVVAVTAAGLHLGW
jgi:hypothetical protein